MGLGSEYCLTVEVSLYGRPKNKNQRQIVIFALVAVVVVWLIVIADYSHGTIHIVSLVLGIPAVGLLLLVALRLYRTSK
jgi:hypothetical protein